MPLMRLFNEDAPFVVGDATEIERPHAKRTEYVGRLKDNRRGYWMLMLGTPCGGRVIPFHAIIYSSKTINSERVSRNTEHIRALEKVWKLIEDVPVVFDPRVQLRRVSRAVAREEAAICDSSQHGQRREVHGQVPASPRN